MTRPARVTRLHHRWDANEAKFSFSNVYPGRGLNPGSRSVIAVNITTRLRRSVWLRPLSVTKQKLTNSALGKKVRFEMTIKYTSSLNDLTNRRSSRGRSLVTRECAVSRIAALRADAIV